MARDQKLTMLEKLFDAKLGPQGEDIREIKQHLVTLQAAVNLAHGHAEGAHKRIDKHENRFIGLMFGSGFAGTGIGALIVKVLS